MPAWIRSGALLVFIASCLAFPAIHWRDLDRSSDARNYALGILRSVPHGATLEVASDNQQGPVAYLRYVEGMRTDLRLVEWYGTLFPETKRRQLADPILTKDYLEMDFLREGGGQLFLPSNRPVQPPQRSQVWGLVYRLTDRVDAPTALRPRWSSLPFHLTAAEGWDIEAQDVTGYYLLRGAEAAAERGDTVEGTRILTEVEARCSRTPNVLVDTAVAYQRLGRSEKVELLLRQALSINPNHYTGNINLGLLYAGKGDFRRSLYHLEKAHAALPQEPMALEFLNRVRAMQAGG